MNGEYVYPFFSETISATQNTQKFYILTNDQDSDIMYD